MKRDLCTWKETYQREAYISLISKFVSTRAPQRHTLQISRTLRISRTLQMLRDTRFASIRASTLRISRTLLSKRHVLYYQDVTNSPNVT